MMSYFNRNKWWTIAFLLLVALNIATLSAFWIMRDKRSGPPPAIRGGVTDFLVKELELDSVQKQQLQQLVEEHRRQVRDIRRTNREAKDAFFALLKEPGIDDTTLANAARNATLPDQLMDIYTFRHFQKVRALCNDVQKRKFDAIIQEVLRMSAPPPGPPSGGHLPPVEGHRPPPAQ
jgi:periplasmic protein CpxP/Spy